MTAEQLFSTVNLAAGASWLLLIALPRVPWVRRTIIGGVVPAALAAVYITLIATHWSGGSFSTLASVGALFDNSWLLLAGWVHYLAFDLLVGVWEVDDAQARHVPHALVVPCLLLTFVFGPAGWLLYQVVRRWAARPAIR